MDWQGSVPGPGPGSGIRAQILDPGSGPGSWIRDPDPSPGSGIRAQILDPGSGPESWIRDPCPSGMAHLPRCREICRRSGTNCGRSGQLCPLDRQDPYSQELFGEIL